MKAKRQRTDQTIKACFSFRLKLAHEGNEFFKNSIVLFSAKNTFSNNATSWS